jgi:hypothetical protein
MALIDDLVPEFIDAYAFDFDGWQITIVAGEIDITAMVTSPTMERDGFAATFEEAPIVKDKVLWVPIEAPAALMNCSVEKDLRSEELVIGIRKNQADTPETAEVLGCRITSVANNSGFPRPEIAYLKTCL